MVKFGWDKLKRFLAQANTWTGKQTFSNIAVTGGTISGATITETFTVSTNPALNAAVTTAIVDAYNGVVVTLSAAGNTQTLQNPTTMATIRKFMVINNDTSNNNLSVVANSVTFTLTPGEGQCFLWDGSAWGPTDLGITEIPVKVTQGGIGASTLTDHGILLGSGTDPVTALTPLAAGELLVGIGGADPHALVAGETTKILVGGGAADPVWTEATGTGAPVRQTSPALVTPALGTPASGEMSNCSDLSETENIIEHIQYPIPTVGYMLKAAADGSQAKGTNTDSDVADAVSKKHAQNTDTGTTATSFKINTGGNEADLQTTGLTADRDYTLPDIDTMLAGSVLMAQNIVEIIEYTP
jgi:hypothetical protein